LYSAKTETKLQCEIFNMIDLLSGLTVVTLCIGIKPGLLSCCLWVQQLLRH